MSRHKLSMALYPSSVPSRSASAPAVLDSHTLSALRAGDALAFSTLHSHYAPLLVSLAAQRTDDVAVAEDLVQDVFLSIWANRDRLTASTSPVGYLFRAVRHRVSNYHRHRRVEASAAQQQWRIIESEEGYSPHVEIEQGIDAVWLRAIVDSAVDALPAQARTTYRLIRDQRLSYAAAAQRLGLSVKTVEMHMTRALRQLRTQLSAATN